MKYVFFGTPLFAKIVLECLGQCGFIPAALVANPDRPAGRKQILTAPLTKQLAETARWDTKLMQPERTGTLHEELRALNPDFFIVAAYAKIIPQEILDIPRLGTIGVHPSLLPRYRGPTPIQSALLGDDKETGTTLFLIDKEVDHGPIIAQKAVAISEHDDYTALLTKLADTSGALLCETLPEFAAGRSASTPQNDAQATFTKKFVSDDGFISYDALREAEQAGTGAREILCKIRALNPEPGVYTLIPPNGKRMKLLGACVREEKLVLTLTQQEGGVPKKH